MANYRGYTVSPVQIGLSQTADILGQGLGAIGKNQLATEELGLRRSMAENQLAQQQEERGLRMPGLKVQSERDRAKLERMNQDLTMGHLTGGGDIRALGHWTSVSESDPSKLTLTEKFSQLMGARYDTDKESQTFGKFVRDDGTPLKVKDLEPKWREVSELILSNTDPDHLLADQLERYADKEKYMKAQGLNDNHPQTIALRKNIDRAKFLSENDEGKIAVYKRHRDLLSKFDNDDARREVAALDAKIAKIEEHGYQERKTKEEHAFRAGESAKDRTSREKEAELNRQANREPKPTEIGKTRSYEAGGEKITQEWDGFKWNTLGTSPTVHTGSGPTAIQKNVPYLSKTLGISEKDAAEILMETKPESERQTQTRLFNKFLEDKGDPQQAKRLTQEAMKIIRELRGEKEQASQPATTGIPDWRNFKTEVPTFRGKIER